MKKIIAIFLCILLMISGCSSSITKEAGNQKSDTSSKSEELDEATSVVPSDSRNLEFKGMDDTNLLSYTQNKVYSDLVNNLNSNDYFVENVEAVYISQEYIDELTYNSQENVYFGYTLQELNQQFEGQRYIFTLGDDGSTEVREMETFYDDSTEQIIKNVALGSGVILICVTVSVVSMGVGAPAVAMIFAGAAQTGTTFAVSSAAISGAATTITTAYQTHDIKAALKQGALSASEGFKFGAIIGAATGGATTTYSLHGATLNGLTMNEAALVQKESGYPLDVIKEFHSVKEYNAFKDANLKSTMIGNKSALVRTDIDLKRIDAKGRTNLERMQQGVSPLDANGKSYELHHVGQRKEGTLAILTQSEHDNPAIHGFLQHSEAHAAGNNWDQERKLFWETFAKMYN